MSEKYDRIESEQKQQNEEYLRAEKMSIVVEQAEYNLFALLKPTLSLDGDSWCCLYGEDLQVGISGFGDTPWHAIMDWNKAWRKIVFPTSAKR